MVQWLRLCAPNAGGTGWIPGWGTKIPHAAWRSQRKKKKKNKIKTSTLYMLKNIKKKKKKRKIIEAEPYLVDRSNFGECPGSPVIKTWRFHC